MSTSGTGNPQQHIYCMSPDSEYVSLIMYATKIEIDLCNFLAIWAVLSILLDTQSNTLQYVRSLQQVMNDYYEKCPQKVMSRLEHQITDIMNAMYDSVNNDNFDSVSGDTDRVSGAVDIDYDKNDKDRDEMPYDKDKHEMPYDKVMMMCPMTQIMSIHQMTVTMIKCLPNMPMIMRQPQIK